VKEKEKKTKKKNKRSEKRKEKKVTERSSHSCEIYPSSFLRQRRVGGYTCLFWDVRPSQFRDPVSLPIFLLTQYDAVCHGNGDKRKKKAKAVRGKYKIYKYNCGNKIR